MPSNKQTNAYKKYLLNCWDIQKHKILDFFSSLWYTLL